LLLCIDIPVPAHACMVQGHTVGHLASAILVKNESSLSLSPQSEASGTMRRSANQMARTPSGLKLDRQGGGGGGLDSGVRSPRFFHGFLSQLPGGQRGGTSLALRYCHPCVGGGDHSLGGVVRRTFTMRRHSRVHIFLATEPSATPASIDSFDAIWDEG
jgi:hypothetical protein